jgi:hypothetical protein
MVSRDALKTVLKEIILEDFDCDESLLMEKDLMCNTVKATTGVKTTS